MIKVSCTSFNQLSACLGAIFSGQWQPLMVSGVSAVSKGSSLWQRLPTVKGTRCRGCCVPAMVCARPENRPCTRGARCTVGPSLRATAEARDTLATGMVFTVGVTVHHVPVVVRVRTIRALALPQCSASWCGIDIPRFTRVHQTFRMNWRFVAGKFIELNLCFQQAMNMVTLCSYWKRHIYSWFTYWSWWFSIVFYVYQWVPIAAHLNVSENPTPVVACSVSNRACWRCCFVHIFSDLANKQRQG